ncbi:HAMP domain-containing histidine kinase [Coprothermobacteraceae bacterium]|nr:HAMP domain-containing histidine kinase [Coprothermobacteraceae bacterium]
MSLNLEETILEELGIAAFTIESGNVHFATTAMTLVPWFSFVKGASLTVNIRRPDVRRALTEGKPMIVKTPKGDSVWSVKPFAFQDRTLVVVRDVTHEKHDQEWSKLLSYHVVHEIRNALNNIVLAMEMIEEPFKSKVESSISRLERLAQQLARLASLSEETRGQVFLVELATYVQDAFDVSVSLQPDCATAVWPVNKDLLTIALTNLLENAQVYGKDPSVTFGPTFITVSDKGPGLPASIMESLFKPFVTTGNVGLGLFLAKRACEIMGLILSYKPNYPSGAVFTISLPSTPNMDLGGGS